MVIAANSPLFSGPYDGDGVTTVFDYDFRIYAETELSVVRTNADTTRDTLTLTTDYTVTGVNADAGGTITLTSAALLPTGATMTIEPNVTASQDRPFSAQTSITLSQIEVALDKLTSLGRQLLGASNRSLRVAVGSGDQQLMPPPVDGRVIMGNPEGDGYINGPTVDQVASANADALAAAASAEAAGESEDLAALWAAEGEDVEVSGGLFSALHYAAKAADSAASIVPENFATAAQGALADTAIQTGPSPILAAGDFNTFITGGFYTLSGVYTNSPLGGSAVSGTMRVYERAFTAGARITQIVSTSGTTPTQYIRVGTGDPAVWSAWRLIVVGPATTSGTPVATTSGTAFDFTSIPAEVQEIDVLLENVSLSGSDNILIQMGTSGGFVTTGYVSSSSAVFGGSAATQSSTAGFVIRRATAANSYFGFMTIKRMAPGSNIWMQKHAGSEATFGVFGSGGISLAGEVTQVRITRSGTDTFDAGSVNVRWR